MKLFLDDKSSLVILRTCARDPSLTLVPTTVREPEPLGLSPARMTRLGCPNLLSYLQVPDGRRLGIVVPEPKDRVRVRKIECSVRKRLRGTTPLYLLSSARASYPNPLVPAQTLVYVQSAANVVLGMAGRLQKRVRRGSATLLQAKLMLVKLCLELCGTYAHDPFDPRFGTVTYEAPQLMTSDQLRAFLDPEGTEAGLGLARSIAPLVYDLSGSPQESFMGPALFYTGQLGGLSLCDFSANEPLSLSPERQRMIGYRTITPDFTLPDYNSVLEFKGRVHEQGNNPEIDHVRSLDYQTLGIREFAFVYEDVKSQEDFMASAARIVSVIEQFDGPGVRERFRRMQRSEAFLGRQKTLFKVFRPWLR